MTLPDVFIITLLGMVFIPPAPNDTLAIIKMVVAIIFITVAWGIYLGLIHI